MAALPADADPLFVTFWDFDGTIIKGDISEGLYDRDQTVFKGMVQIGCEAGHARDFQGTSGFARFWEEYERLEREYDRYTAYTFLPKIFVGAPEAALRALARDQFDSVFYRYFYRASVETIRALQAADVMVTIISASPEVFVDGAAARFGIDPELVTGIEVAIDAGRMTDRLVEPVNFAAGKARRVRLYIEEIGRRNPGRTVVPLAGFGDSQWTDGAFLLDLTRRELPGLAGWRPAAWIVNPPRDLREEYRAAFRPLHFDSIMGADS